MKKKIMLCILILMIILTTNINKVLAATDEEEGETPVDKMFTTPDELTYELSEDWTYDDLTENEKKLWDELDAIDDFTDEEKREIFIEYRKIVAEEVFEKQAILGFVTYEIFEELSTLVLRAVIQEYLNQNPNQGQSANIDTDYFKPDDLTEDDYKVAFDMTGNIVHVITVIGIVISIVTIIVLGIKYMYGSVEERADYKRTMIPVMIGAILIFAASTIVSVIYSIVSKL